MPPSLRLRMRLLELLKSTVAVVPSAARKGRLAQDSQTDGRRDATVAALADASAGLLTQAVAVTPSATWLAWHRAGSERSD